MLKKMHFNGFIMSWVVRAAMALTIQYSYKTMFYVIFIIFQTIQPSVKKTVWLQSLKSLICENK